MQVATGLERGLHPLCATTSTRGDRIGRKHLRNLIAGCSHVELRVKPRSSALRREGVRRPATAGSSHWDVCWPLQVAVRPGSRWSIRENRHSSTGSDKDRSPARRRQPLASTTRRHRRDDRPTGRRDLSAASGAVCLPRRRGPSPAPASRRLPRPSTGNGTSRAVAEQAGLEASHRAPRRTPDDVHIDDEDRRPPPREVHKFGITARGKHVRGDPRRAAHGEDAIARCAPAAPRTLARIELSARTYGMSEVSMSTARALPDRSLWTCGAGRWRIDGL